MPHMKRLTLTQLKIIACINLAGGSFTSLNRLTSILGINYSWAWLLLQRLETTGHITIIRSGRDLVITRHHIHPQ